MWGSSGREKWIIGSAPEPQKERKQGSPTKIRMGRLVARFGTYNTMRLKRATRRFSSSIIPPSLALYGGVVSIYVRGPYAPPIRRAVTLGGCVHVCGENARPISTDLCCPHPFLAPGECSWAKYTHNTVCPKSPYLVYLFMTLLNVGIPVM